MGPRAEYAPGTFSWVDLATSDVDAAKTFYADLFGWTTEDDPGGTRYTLCRRDGDVVCGIAALPTGAGSSSWTSYVTVADVDATFGQAVELGGRPLGEPFAVADYGRTAMLTDPQDAPFALWQPGARAGAERVNDVGCLCMNELATTDTVAARDFYGALFDWTFEVVDTGADGPELIAVMNHGSLNAHISPTESGEAPAWRPYFTVESAAASVEQVTRLGGSATFGPFPIPDGAIAGVADSQGARFALFEGETDP